MAVYPVIQSNGSDLPIAIELISVEVVREANRVPYARLVMDGGDVPTATFPALTGDALAPGATIAVSVRDGDVTTALFTGLIVRLAFTLDSGAPQIVVECQDAAFRLTKPRRTAVYAKMSDADAIAAILKRAGVTAGALGSGDPQPALVQYDASDWDFVLARAATNGCAVVVTDGTVDLKPLAIAGDPALSLQLGIDEIDELELELDAGGQFPDVAATAWNPTQAGEASAAAADPLTLAQGDLDPTDLAGKLGLTAESLVQLVPLPSGEAKSWASSRLAQARLGLVRGRLTTSGSAVVAPMDLIAIAGVGARFNGKALVTGVRHLVDDGGWRTDYRLGLPADGLFQPAAALPPIAAQGLLPAARGLHVGVVADYEDDPDGEFRVRVVLPELAGADGPLWARLATPEAGGGRGQVFRPDAGDEVVIGFLGDDPRFPVVLGALYGSKNAPPDDFAPSADNIGKGLLTKHGIAIAFKDQDKPVVVVKTKAGTLTIDDDQETVSLSDGHDNKLTMDKSGVTIAAGKDFTVQAKGAVKIKGKSIDLN